MGVFQILKSTVSKFRAQKWDDLNESQAAERTQPLLSLNLALLDALDTQAILPGSRESQKFNQFMRDSAQELIHNTPEPKRIAELREELDQRARSHGYWQRKAVHGLTDAAASATQELVASLNIALTEQQRLMTELQNSLQSLQLHLLGNEDEALHQKVDRLKEALNKQSIILTRLQGEYEYASKTLISQREEQNEMSATDKLTGGLNMSGFFAEIQRKLNPIATTTSSPPFRITAIEIVDYADLVDQHGKKEMQTILTGTFWTLKQQLPPETTIARIGDSEFGLILSSTADQDQTNTQQILKFLETVKTPTGMPLIFNIGHAGNDYPDDSPQSILSRAVISGMRNPTPN